MTLSIAFVLVALMARAHVSDTHAQQPLQPSAAPTVQRVAQRALSSHPTSSKTPKNPAVLCIQQAVTAREDAIQEALDAYHADMTDLLQSRKTAIVAQWANTNEKKRDQSIRSVWRSFGMAWKMRGTGLRNDVRSAWEAYRIQRSDCGVYGEKDPEMGGLGADSQM